MSVPESIRSALEGRPPRRSVGVRMPISPGQVRVIRPALADHVLEIGVPERMVLVVRLDSRDFAEVMLVHPHVELATSVDLVVSPERSTMPYQVVVETDTRAVVRTDQIDTLIGKFDADSLGALGEVAVGRAVHQKTLTSGMPLRGPLDPRWDFKAGEGAVIRSLAADCTSALLYDGLPLRLDPGCLAPRLLGACGDLESMTYKLLDFVTIYDIVFNLDDVQVLEDIGALEVANWSETFGALGQEFYKSFCPLVEQARSTADLMADSVDDPPISELMAARRFEAGPLRTRTGHIVVSAAYVWAERGLGLKELADAHGVVLIH